MECQWWYNTYPSENMTTEKAILSLVRIPPSLFIIQKGWPFFCHKLKVGVIVIEHGNGPGKGISNVQDVSA
jgi:hypothetical protein